MDRRRSRIRAGWVSALTLLGGGCYACGGAERADGGLGQTVATATATADAASSATTDHAPPPTDWREALRQHRWDQALKLLDELPKEQRNEPTIRLARGRAALAAGQHAQAVEALQGLEAALPAVAGEIQAWYAQAAAVAGPHEAAAKLFSTSPKVQDQISAAVAYQRAGKLKTARKVVDKAIRQARQTRRHASEEQAHEVRATIAEAARDKAVAGTDWRWLVSHAKDPARVRKAITGFDRVGGRLSVPERVAALARSTSHDNLAATLTELDALGDKHKTQAAVIAMGRAQALNQARDYAQALGAFDAAGALPTPHLAEIKYYAARCAARSGDVTGAIDRYAEIPRRFRKSGWAERAAYRRAELLLRTGRYTEAAAAYARYSSRFGKSKWRARARYGRAMALLSCGKPAEAKTQFAALRKDASNRRFVASLRHLEGVAALRSGDQPTAKKLWLDLIEEQPLTWPALAAHARLKQLGHTPLPPVMPLPPTTAHAALPLTLPAAPALLHSVGLDAAAEGRLALMEQEAAARYPGRESEALCGLYGLLTGARRRYQVGSRAVSLEQLMRPPSTAERWTWTCVYPYPFPDLVRREEQRYGLPTGLVHAVMRQESAFQTTARSPVGARGLMQLMPATASRAAAEAGIDPPNDILRPDINIRLGAFYLAKLLDSFNGSVPLAVAAYNAGPQAVQSWVTDGDDRDVDVWVARIPYRETRHYVQRVLGNLSRYQWLAGGNGAVMPAPLQLPKETDIGDQAY